MARTLSQIAREIRSDWKNPYFGATPYLEAMSCLNKPSERYGQDTGYSIIRYFLANSQSWRGETARRVKAELREFLQ